MPSRTLQSFTEFSEMLDATLAEAETLAARYPRAPEYAGIHRQLAQLREWTRGGRRPD